MIELTRTAIDSAAVLAGMPSAATGAVVLFLGTTRAVTGEKHTAWLAYEAYESMALAKLAELEAEARRRWQLCDCRIVHRLGRVDPGEASVAVAVSTAHRRAAFEAGQWLIDTLKALVPIWKEEHWTDGTSEWVHPAANASPTCNPS